MKNIRKFSPVEIVWVDAEFHSDPGWKTKDEYKRWTDGRRYYKQSGYYIESKDGHINLCSGFSASKDGEVQSTCGINSIPKGCIKTIRRLR